MFQFLLVVALTTQHPGMTFRHMSKSTFGSVDACIKAGIVAGDAVQARVKAMKNAPKIETSVSCSVSPTRSV
jgi:hypothetical protein